MVVKKNPPPLTNEIDALNKSDLTKKRRAWFITCVNEAVVQTLEEISFNVSLPQTEQVIHSPKITHH